MPPSSSNLKVCKVTFLHPLSKTRPHYVKATLHLRHLATLQLCNMARLASQAAFSAMHLFSWDLKRMRCIFDFVNAGQELPHKKFYRFVCWVPVPVALCAVTFVGNSRYKSIATRSSTNSQAPGWSSVHATKIVLTLFSSFHFGGFLIIVQSLFDMQFTRILVLLRTSGMRSDFLLHVHSLRTILSSSEGRVV